MSSEVPTLQCHKLVGGFYHPATSGWFQTELQPRWRGPGPCLFISDGPKATADFFIATAIHELAHVVLSTPMFLSSPIETVTAETQEQIDPPDDSLTPERLKTIVVTTPKEWPAYKSAPRWFTHDCDFIRATFHVAYRMVKRDHRVCPRLLLCWDDYGYSGWQGYY